MSHQLTGLLLVFSCWLLLHMMHFEYEHPYTVRLYLFRQTSAVVNPIIFRSTTPNSVDFIRDKVVGLPLDFQTAPTTTKNIDKKTDQKTFLRDTWSLFHERCTSHYQYLAIYRRAGLRPSPWQPVRSWGKNNRRISMHTSDRFYKMANTSALAEQNPKFWTWIDIPHYTQITDLAPVFQLLLQESQPSAKKRTMPLRCKVGPWYV